MRKLLFFTAVFLMMTGSALAEVQYRGVMDSEEVRMNVSIQLECDSECPISSWNLDWNLPENAEILELKDSLGEIDNYDRTGRTVTLSTNNERRYNETVEIYFRIDEEAEEVYDGLYFRRMSFPSFNGERTTGIIEVEDLISGWIGFGFQSSFDNESFRFRGEGPVNIRAGFGQGEETEYYEFFGEKKPNSTEAYRVSLGSTGLAQDFERFPVAVIPPDVYSDTRPGWSQGEYIGGEITLRENSENYLPTLTHETVHGLNDRFFRWDFTGSTYLDEGIAEHVEYLMTKKLYREGRTEIGTRELFGDQVMYSEQVEEGALEYTLSSQGKKDRLWNYYQEDSDFMKDWNPRESLRNRDFGYAYSHLLVKNYLSKNNTIIDLYSEIGQDSKIESSDRKWSFLSEHMEMEPCNYDSRERFNRCLDRINSYDYRIYTADRGSADSELEVEELEVPNRTERSPNVEKADVSFYDFVKGFIDYILSIGGIK